MAIVIPGISRTFSEYLLLPNLTRRECIPANVSLRSPLTRRRPPAAGLTLNVPLVSAMMQSVSDDTMAVALARSGGLAFIFTSQPIADQAEMVRRVKKFKAGFVVSDTNVTPQATLRDVLDRSRATGHTTMAVTDNGAADGRLLGILTGRDYRIGHVAPEQPVARMMTPFEELVYGRDGISLTEANNLIWEHRLNCLPIIDGERRLRYLVFRKDYDEHKENPDELIDHEKRLMVGAGINTHDYRERVPSLLEAGVDVLCIDSSDGFSEFQRDCLAWVRERYGDAVSIGAGNVVDGEGFRYLAAAGADFVKVGVGPGSICITREQKGLGRGQASAVLDVAAARDRLFRESGQYIPICADGGHLPRLSHHPGVGHGRGLRDDGPLLRALRREPRRRACAWAPTSSRSTGAKAPSRRATGSATTARRRPPDSPSRRGWTATCPTPASCATTSTRR